MRKIIEKLVKKIYNKEIALEKVPLKYIAIYCLEREKMAIRGFMASLFNKGIKKKTFIGKNVKLKCKSKMYFGNSITLYDDVVIDALSEEGCVFGNNVSIGKGTVIQLSGTISNIGKGLRIGNNSSCGNNCSFGAAGGISIGNDVIMGSNIRFHAENHNYNDKNILIRDQGVNHKGIVIGNNCWIGAGTVFLDGAEVGDGCVIGANTLVNKKFPNNAVIVGTPARILKYR